MNPIEEYLQSAQCREDIAKLLADAPRRERKNGTIKPAGQAVVAPISRKIGLFMAPDGAWTRVRLSSRDPAGLGHWVAESAAYYRPEGDGRYIVTDLGDGVKALRMRTGGEAPSFYHVRHLLTDRVGYCQGGDIAHSPSVAAEQLPDAIARVMLASWRVANLGVNGDERGATV